MDKLKPILEQKFWILSGLCLILPITGWWLAAGSIAAAYDARKKSIDEAHNGIPSPGPNKHWTEKVKDLNKEEDRKVKETEEFLLSKEAPLRSWPEALKEVIEKVPFGKEIDSRTRTEYRYVYEKELEDTTKILSPFNPEDGTGLVDASPDLLPNLGWRTSPVAPTSPQIWDTQEDIWLYRALYQAIANINTPPGGNATLASTSIVDSKIKQVVYVELRGGGPKVAAGGGATTAMDPKAAALPPGAAQAGPSGAPAGYGTAGQAGAMGGAGAGSETPVASFDGTEVFGDDTDSSGGTAGGGTGAATTAPAAAPAAGAAEMAGKGAMMGGMGGQNVARKRYIDDNDRYKTRGFYLEVVMDHRYLPEFISELSDSPWPVKILRVQMVDRDLSDIGSNTVGTYGSQPGMGGGMMAGGRGGMGAMGKGMSGMGGGRSMRSSPSGSGMMSRSRDKEGGRGGSGVAPKMSGTPKLGGAGYGTGDFGGAAGDGTVSVEAALSDPFLVDVAIAGVFTIYKEKAADTAVTPGAAAPATPGTTPPAGTPATAAGTPMATTAPAVGAAPMTGTVPAATAPATGTPAAATAPAATPATATPTAPGTPPAAGTTPSGPPATGTPPPASPAAPPANTTPPPATNPPAGTPPAAPAAEKPAAAK